MKNGLIQIIIVLTLLTFSQSLKATHAYGAELFYRHVSDSTYEVTLTFYRNCIGFAASAPTSMTLRSISSSLNQNYTVLLTRLPTLGAGVPPLEPPDLFNCMLNNNACVEEYVYRGMWTANGKARDWVLSTSLCCRPGPAPYSNAPTNIGYSSLWVEAGLNNMDFPDEVSRNWSPIFHNRRPNHPGHLTDTIKNYGYKSLCEGVFYTLDQSAKEYQGDSLSYNFYIPQGNAGTNVSYLSPYTFTSPMPTYNGVLSINPITGIIPVVPGKPRGTGVYVIGVEVQEWRKDTVFSSSGMQVMSKRIGYNRRDMMIYIQDSSNCRKDSLHPRTIVLDTLNVDKKLKVTFHNGIASHPNSRIRCNTLSPDGSEFRIVDSSGYVAPFDSTLRYVSVLSAHWLCQDGFTKEVELTLSEPLKCGNYSIFLKEGTDLDVIMSECGFWEPAYSSAEIVTQDSLPSVDLGPDLTTCKFTNWSILLDAGPGYASYYWDTWDTTQTIVVSFPRSYVVEVQNKFACIDRDTLIIREKPCSSSTLSHSYRGTWKVNKYTGIDDENFESKMEYNVYPNPISKELNVEFQNVSGELTVTLINELGTVLTSQSINLSDSKTTFNVESYPSGLYVLLITRNEELIARERIVIRRN